MSFGALFAGNSGQVIIDQDYPVYHVVHRGSYNFNPGGGVNKTVNFPSPVQSSSLPLIFFRPSGSHRIYNFRVNGSPNNWTGFTFSMYADSQFSNISFAGEWMVAAIYLPIAGAWGLKVLDESSRVVFDSNREVVKFSSAVQSWAKFGHNGSWMGYYTTDTFRAPYSPGKWFMVSIWSGGSLGGMYGSEVGVGFLDAGSTTATYVYCFVTQPSPGMNSINSCNWPLILAA